MGVSGITLLKQMLPNLSPSEQKIAKFIIENPNNAIRMTAQEIGQASNSSNAGIVRLSKSLGLSGWQELKLLLASERINEDAIEIREVSKNEKTSNIISKIANNTMSTIEQTKKITSEEDIEIVTKMMYESKRIHFYGIGASYTVSLDAMHKWSKVNKQCSAMTDLHLLMSIIANADQDDLLFLISFSGETTEVLKLAMAAKESGIKIVTLTKYSKNKLVKYADVNLYSSATEEFIYPTAYTTSRINQLFVIDILFFNYVSKYYEESICAIDNSRTVLQKHI
ncbi:MurR/RpiR family transcriptional regulator [Cytobacillus firmus]|uniref:MurR/RpiR family transcriptional regulator n=1 Tax=Cytobacillus firmus TaxID=1399 RepID=UPI001C8ED5E9|nr:MurR/RpiR family transcriptional regulator [Cytobacillus firmus]MBX9975070.1 MurR/RpiR family transcriptional regulator [Cytobacillus firmus]